MYRTEDEFWDWLEDGATPAERYLADKVRDFEDLFEDMVFAEGSITNNSTSDAEEGIQYKTMDVDPDLKAFSYCSLHYQVEANDMDDGSYNKETHTISIDPGQLMEDHTILHEMIHAYMQLQNEVSPLYHDMACWALYKDLRGKILRLDLIIDDVIDTTMRNYKDRGNGAHDILFLLKSLDLDIRMGYPLGRVFAYGVEEFLSERVTAGDKQYKQREVISSG